tara:strand:+ start:11667 stop:12050 length:384 start_codon:yes stop_codon:yes gene_type:complete
MLSTAAKSLIVAYFAGAGILCVLSKVDHKRFALSHFCSNETLLVESGKFGPRHCLEHLEQWQSFSAWRDEFVGIAFPSIPAQISFALALAIVSASKWLDIIVIAAGIVTSLALVRKFADPLRQKKQA